MLEIPKTGLGSTKNGFVMALGGKLNMGNLPSTVSTVPMAIGNLAWATTHVGDTCKQKEKQSLQPSECSFCGNYVIEGTVWQ